MPTPMQFQLINKLLEAANHPSTRSGNAHFYNSPDGSGGRVDATMITQSWVDLAHHVSSGVPLVDATDIWKQLAFQKGETTTWSTGYFIAVMKPWLKSESFSPPVPWPIFLLSCDLGHGEISMWAVYDAVSVRQAVSIGQLPIPANLRGKTDGASYFVSPYAATLVNGVLAATGIRDQEPVEWAGLNRWALCTRLTLAYAAAKNASWIEAAPDRKTRKHSPALAGIRFRSIEIDMGKPKRRADGEDPESEGVPWHHRRGHWAHYSEDKPLFGRAGAHGWYWRPYTEVGDKKHGEIVQDYSVMGNLPNEAP